MKKVLVVDDEPSIVTLLTFNLEKEGYEVTTASEGDKALQLALTEAFDFILLDVMLPGMDGFEITRQLRNQHIQTPIILLTAKDETIDRVLGLEIGADDYVSKPFSPREVLARMKAITRRLPKETTATLVNGPLVMKPKEKQVLFHDKSLILTKKEFELLYYFMSHLDHVIERETLLQEVWGASYLGESRMVDIHVSHLREKIETDPKQPQFIQTIRGVGYKMVCYHEA